METTKNRILMPFLMVLILASMNYAQPKISQETNVALHKKFYSSAARYSNYFERYVTDGYDSTFFWTGNASDGTHFTVDLGKVYPAHRIRIIQSITRSFDYANGELQYSIDDSNWVALKNVSGKTINYSFSKTPIRYFRLIKKSGNSWVQIGEMQTFCSIPESFDFGKIEVGEFSEVTFAIHNEGDAVLEITNLMTDDDAFVVSDSSFSVFPDSSHDISVSYVPRIGGIAQGILSFASNDPNKPTVLIQLSGLGLSSSGPIKISSFQIDDDNENAPSDSSRGNNDGKVHQGETIRLLLSLVNAGSDTANDVVAILSTNHDGITITDSTHDFGFIAGGEIKTAGIGSDRDAFQFHVSDSAIAGYNALFTLKITSTNAGLYRDSLEIPIFFYQPPDTLWAPWPMDRHDAQCTGRSPYNGPENPFGTWHISGVYGNRILIAANDNILVGNKIFAPNGKIIKELQYYSAAIDAAGIIYCLGDNASKLYAFDFDGNQKWGSPVGGGVNPSPAIGSDGTIYVTQNVADTSRLLAIDPSDGNLKWKFLVSQERILTSPAIALEGSIYFATNKYMLYSVDRHGEKKWSAKFGDYIEFSFKVSSPVISKDGTVYIAAGDDNGKYLHAIKNGTIKWKSRICGWDDFLAPAIGKNSIIYTGAKSAYGCFLYAINPNGNNEWSLTLDKASGGTNPVIGADGVIYVGVWYKDFWENSPGHFYAINPDGNIKWSSADTIPNFPGKDYWKYTAIGNNGTLYILTEYGHPLYVLSEEPDIIPPQNPKAIPGVYQITLKWDPDSKGNVSRYKIYRSLQASFIPTSRDSIGQVICPATAFIDSTLDKVVKYYYRITAVDSQNNESEPSVEVSAVPFGIAINSPTNGQSIASMPVKVTGHCGTEKNFIIAVNGLKANLNENEFSAEIYLTNGPRKIIACLWDVSSNLIASDTVNVSVVAPTPCIGMSGQYYGVYHSYINGVEDWIKFELDRFLTKISIFEAMLDIQNYNFFPPIHLFLPIKVENVSVQNNSFRFQGNESGLLTYSFSGRFTTINSSSGSYSAQLDPYYGSWNWSATNDTAKIRASCILQNFPSQIPQNSEIEYQVLVRNLTNTSLSLEYAAEVRLSNGVRLFDSSPKWIILAPNVDSLLTTKINIPAGSVKGLTTMTCVVSTLKKPLYVFQQTFDIITSMNDESNILTPSSFGLFQNYPNPFNLETTIKYQLPKTSEVTIKIYNITGQLVKILLDQKQPAGYYSVNWNGKNDRGWDVSSGVYLYRLNAEDFVQTRKMLLVR